MNEPATPRRSPVMTPAHGAGGAAPDPSGVAGATGSSSHGGSALKLAIVGPSHANNTYPDHADFHHLDSDGCDRGGVSAHTTILAHLLAQAGHDVTVVAWSHPLPRRRRERERERAVSPRVSEVPPFSRTVPALSWSRPDTWVRAGRRLRGFDAIIVVHAMPLLVPAHLVMLRAAGVGAAQGDASTAPRAIVIAHNVLPHEPALGDIALIRSLFARVDAVVVHSADQARLAQDLQATRVSVAAPVHIEPHPRLQQADSHDLSSPWAHYVGAMEALASPDWQAAEQDPADSSAPSLRARLTAQVRQSAQRHRPVLSLTRRDLPSWVRPSDVLGDAADADEARAWARSHRLPRCADPIAAWSALGALAAIVRLGDDGLRVRGDGQRSAVIADGSGPRSPLSRWARAIGFSPVELDLAGTEPDAGLDVDTASLDVVTLLHPNGCDSEDVDEALSQASWALRSGGLISLTLPLGPATADGAVGPADVRAILARAADLGLVLVGDLDGEMARLMRAAGEGERRQDAAYALVRLTFRRR